MGSQQLDNQMKEQAVKCEDFERSYEREIQHLEAEWIAPATTREEKTLKEKTQVLKEKNSNWALIAENSEKTVKELEEADQIEPGRTALWGKKNRSRAHYACIFMTFYCFISF